MCESTLVYSGKRTGFKSFNCIFGAEEIFSWVYNQAYILDFLWKSSLLPASLRIFIMKLSTRNNFSALLCLISISLIYQHFEDSCNIRPPSFLRLWFFRSFTNIVDIFDIQNYFKRHLSDSTEWLILVPPPLVILYCLLNNSESEIQW